MIDIVYFSSRSGNTKKFINKLGREGKKIPLEIEEAKNFTVDDDYILFVPTYSGGDDRKGAVPKQVIQFLNNEENRKHIKGVISSGNKNFGNQFAISGDVIAQKCNIPKLYAYELIGTDEDVREVKEILSKF